MGLLEEGEILEAAATSCGKWWRPIVGKEKVKAEGRDEILKCGSRNTRMMPNFRLASEK